MVKEQVFEILKSHGFRVKKLGEHSYVFSYEGLNIQYMPDDDDESFFRMTLPCLAEVSEDNRPLYLEICNEANVQLKYVKVNIVEGDLWAAYENRYNEGTDLDDLVTHSIFSLQASSFFIERLLSGKASPSDSSKSDSDDSDSDTSSDDELGDFDFDALFTEDADEDNEDNDNNNE